MVHREGRLVEHGHIALGEALSGVAYDKGVDLECWQVAVTVE